MHVTMPWMRFIWTAAVFASAAVLLATASCSQREPPAASLNPAGGVGQPETGPQDLLLPEDCLVAALDVRKLLAAPAMQSDDVATAVADLRDELGVEARELRRVLLLVADPRVEVDGEVRWDWSLARRASLYVESQTPFDRERLIAGMYPRPQVMAAAGREIHHDAEVPLPATCFLDDRALLIAPRATLVRRLASRPGENSLRDRWALLEQDHLLAVAPRDDLIEPGLPALLAPLSAAGGKAVVERGQQLIRSVALTLDVSEDLPMRVRLTPRFPEQADELDHLARDVASAMRAWQQFSAPRQTRGASRSEQLRVALLTQFAQGLRVRREGSDILLGVDHPQWLNGIVALGKEQHREAQEQLEEAVLDNQLYGVGQALAHYVNAHGHYPPLAIRDAQGRPLLSWRVALLPYLHGGGELYERFRLDEPWDSPHNRALLSETPDVFAVGEGKESGATRLRAVVGPGTVLGAAEPLTPNAIQDSRAGTALVVGVGKSQAIPWTQPEPADYQPSDPLAFLGPSRHPGFRALTADYSVRCFRRNMPAARLAELFGYADGAPANWRELECRP